jgi:hypothetical protein
VEEDRHMSHNFREGPGVLPYRRMHSAWTSVCIALNGEKVKKCRPYWLYFWCCFYSAVVAGGIRAGAVRPDGYFI